MQRRYDLDWLRVIAFGLLMLFHTGMMFSTWDWHVKNLETSDGLDLVMRFLHQWRMPLLFFISGSAVWFAMDRYSTWKFFLERQKRLLVPLIFGMLVIIPPQIYCERLYHYSQYDSFWDFYRTVFTDGSYPEGNLSWHHLWYIPYIWAYSMIMLPFFVLARTRMGRVLLDRCLSKLQSLWLLFLIFIPSALAEVVLRPYWPHDNCSLTNDWANFAHKLSFFVIGFLLASGTGVYDQIARHRRKFLAAGIAALALLYPIWLSVLHLSWLSEQRYYDLSNFNIWMWILTALGYGRRYLSFNHPFLRHATEAVYPFYILHQTIIIALAYQLAYVNWSIPVKFVLVVSSTFGIAWAIYVTLIRPWNPMRLVFGLKWNKKPVAGNSRQPAPTPPSGRGVARAATMLVIASCVLLFCGCSRSGGTMVIEKIHAPSLSGNQLGITDQQPVAIYLPPSYHNSNKRFPVVYFLPNFGNCLWRYTGGTYQGFHLRQAVDQQIKLGSAREMIVVIPNAAHPLGTSWYRNSPLLGNWEDYVVNDLVQYVDSHFRTIATPAARGLSGHGVGGAGALELSLKHPEVFGSVYAMSPAVFDPNGLRDSGLVNDAFLGVCRDNCQKWGALEGAAQRRTFRDYMQRRLNSPRRDRFSEVLGFSYAAAVSTDTSQPFPHVAFPSPGTTNQSEVMQRFENGLGGWSQKIADYKTRRPVPGQITIEYGKEDEFQWLRRGAEHVSRLMRTAGIDTSLVVSDGGHDSTLGKRLEAMLPAMSKSLRSE